MALTSYATIAEVEALSRPVFDGDAGFSKSTEPTAAEVTTIMNRLSAVLDVALSGRGFSVPLTNETAVAACAHWVVTGTIHELRLAYPGRGFGGEEDSPDAWYPFRSAVDFAKNNEEAFKALDETVGEAVSQGLSYTALLKHSQRSDPDNTNYAQPMFRRGQWDR